MAAPPKPLPRHARPIWRRTPGFDWPCPQVSNRWRRRLTRERPLNVVLLTQFSLGLLGWADQSERDITMRSKLLMAGFSLAVLIPAAAQAQTTCEQRSQNRTAGTVVGGLAGALLGSAVA